MSEVERPSFFHEHIDYPEDLRLSLSSLRNLAKVLKERREYRDLHSAALETTPAGTGPTVAYGSIAPTLELLKRYGRSEPPADNPKSEL